MQHRFVASNPSLPLLTLNKFLNCFSLLYFWLFQVQMKIRLFASCCPSTPTKSTSLLLPITPWKIYHVPHFTHQIYRERHCHVTHITFWSGLEQLTWTSVGEWRPVTISCCALVWLWFVKSVNRLHILYNDYLKTWAQIDDNEITMTFCFTKFKGQNFWLHFSICVCFQWKCCRQFPVDICVSRAQELCQSSLAVHCYWLYFTWECVCVVARTQVRPQHYRHKLYLNIICRDNYK